MAVTCYYYEPEPPPPAFTPDYVPPFEPDAEWRYHPDYVATEWRESFHVETHVEHITEEYTSVIFLITCSLVSVQPRKQVPQASQTTQEAPETAPRAHLRLVPPKPRVNGRLILAHSIAQCGVAYEALKNDANRPDVKELLVKWDAMRSQFEEL